MTNELFFQFIKQKATYAEKLFILGDFFEFWLGDDDDTELHDKVITALKTLHAAGTQVYIMHGNRDFLMGKRFFKASKSLFLKDPTIVKLYDHKILLLHGDSLCTDDLKYQRYRRIANLWIVQKWFLAHSLANRRKIALKLRDKNPHKGKEYAPEHDISDVTEKAVLKAFQKHHLNIMIHGHTHRMGIHYYDNAEKIRYVLGDWHDQGSYIKVSEKAITLHEWPDL